MSSDAGPGSEAGAATDAAPKPDATASFCSEGNARATFCADFDTAGANLGLKGGSGLFARDTTEFVSPPNAGLFVTQSAAVGAASIYVIELPKVPLRQVNVQFSVRFESDVNSLNQGYEVFQVGLRNDAGYSTMIMGAVGGLFYVALRDSADGGPQTEKTDSWMSPLTKNTWYTVSASFVPASGKAEVTFSGITRTVTLPTGTSLGESFFYGLNVYSFNGRPTTEPAQVRFDDVLLRVIE
jgi:hypothetical protein